MDRMEKRWRSIRRGTCAHPVALRSARLRLPMTARTRTRASTHWRGKHSQRERRSWNWRDYRRTVRVGTRGRAGRWISINRVAFVNNPCERQSDSKLILVVCVFLVASFACSSSRALAEHVRLFCAPRDRYVAACARFAARTPPDRFPRPLQVSRTSPIKYVPPRSFPASFRAQTDLVSAFPSSDTKSVSWRFCAMGRRRIILQ